MLGALKLPGESDKPFTYLGIVTYFNEIDIEQSRDYIQASCHNYIDRVMWSRRWNEDKSNFPAKLPSPLQPDSPEQLFGHSGKKIRQQVT